MGKYSDGRDGCYFNQVRLINNAKVRFATILSSAINVCSSVDDSLWLLIFTTYKCSSSFLDEVERILPGILFLVYKIFVTLILLLVSGKICRNIQQSRRTHLISH